MNDPSQFLLYTAPNGAVKVDVCFKDETAWLTQKALAELFGVQRLAVTKHLLNIFASGELAEDSVCSILEHTAGDGKNYSAKYYNLDAIIAVGYRVNSFQATQFRIWATKTLREFIIKGFVMDDERLKQGKRSCKTRVPSAPWKPNSRPRANTKSIEFVRTTITSRTSTARSNALKERNHEPRAESTKSQILNCPARRSHAS